MMTSTDGQSLSLSYQRGSIMKKIVATVVVSAQ